MHKRRKDIDRWVVGEYPGEDSAGRLLLDVQYKTRLLCEQACDRLKAEYPQKDFEPCDLDELAELWSRHISAMN
jgi:hypothetical protein